MPSVRRRSGCSISHEKTRNEANRKSIDKLMVQEELRPMASLVWPWNEANLPTHANSLSPRELVSADQARRWIHSLDSERGQRSQEVGAGNGLVGRLDLSRESPPNEAKPRVT